MIANPAKVSDLLFPRLLDIAEYRVRVRVKVVGEEAPDGREPRFRERPERFAWTREIAARYGIEIPPPDKQTQAKGSK